MQRAPYWTAIDVEASISRAMTEITSAEHQALVRRFRQLYATYRHNEDLISVGAYRAGSDPRIDAAIAYWPRIQEFLRQDLQQAVDWSRSLEGLHELVGQSPETSPVESAQA